MQRIDENTYIDDTLVTCAEYQLFIDEMREEEKYYQPDHWTSYQFPEGQAREPILGVRYADAVAFCEWLTQREGGEWNYRLAKNKDLVEHPVKIPSRTDIGYWIIDENSEAGFAWIGKKPEKVRALDVSRDTEFGGYLRHNFDDLLFYNELSDDVSRTKFLSGLVDFLVPRASLDRIVYPSLFILKDRIAGRSPAFEGIRLVKERIR